MRQSCFKTVVCLLATCILVACLSTSAQTFQEGFFLKG